MYSGDTCAVFDAFVPAGYAYRSGWKRHPGLEHEEVQRERYSAGQDASRGLPGAFGGRRGQRREHADRPCFLPAPVWARELGEPRQLQQSTHITRPRGENSTKTPTLLMSDINRTKNVNMKIRYFAIEILYPPIQQLSDSSYVYDYLWVL